MFDWNTERVSYAVISTRPKGIFTPGEKLLAVPLNALTASPDGKHLILNAEKSKVETAVGFDRNHWPGVVSPSWGAEPFWQEDNKDTNMSGMLDESAAGPGAPCCTGCAAGLDPEMEAVMVNVVPGFSPAPDNRPGGLAWPGW